jgi:hypothetical protein
MTTGNMNTLLSVTIANFRLPNLSCQITFTATFEVAPPKSRDFGCRIIMGIGMMDELGIDQSHTDKIITWGHDVQVPMVPFGYWTDAHIQMICKHDNTEKEHTDSESKNLEIKQENWEDKQNVKFATETNSDLCSATSKPAEASFKKAVMKSPISWRLQSDGKHLAPTQQALLFNILTTNEEVFRGGHGHYNGAPVGLKLKDDAKPFCAKPYPIPLKNREVIELKLGQQCSIGTLGCLTPEKFEEREWPFPTFGMPKKN